MQLNPPFDISSFTVVKSNFPDLRKIAAVHSAMYGAMYIFPRENNADGQPVVRLYTQVDKMTGSKSKELPWEAKDRVTANDIMEADKRVRSSTHFDCGFLMYI